MSTLKCGNQSRKLNTNCRFIDANLHKIADFVICIVSPIAEHQYFKLVIRLTTRRERYFATTEQNSE